MFGPDLRFPKRIGKKGKREGEFLNPITFVHGPGDRLYVSDFKNHRVQVFDSKGNFLFLFGEEGDGSGQFKYPVGLAFDSTGRLFVADRNNHRVQVFTVDGQPLDLFGKFGHGE